MNIIYDTANGYAVLGFLNVTNSFSGNFKTA